MNNARRWIVGGCFVLALVGVGRVIRQALVGVSPDRTVEINGVPYPAHPRKLDGTRSYEFEREDFRAAAIADKLVEIYCGGIASEAQRLGCLPHVTEDEVC